MALSFATGSRLRSRIDEQRQSGARCSPCLLVLSSHTQASRERSDAMPARMRRDARNYCNSSSCGVDGIRADLEGADDRPRLSTNFSSVHSNGKQKSDQARAQRDRQLGQSSRSTGDTGSHRAFHDRVIWPGRRVSADLVRHDIGDTSSYLSAGASHRSWIDARIHDGAIGSPQGGPATS